MPTPAEEVLAVTRRLLDAVAAKYKDAPLPQEKKEPSKDGAVKEKDDASTTKSQAEDKE